jgi:hypothetical protein
MLAYGARLSAINIGGRKGLAGLAQEPRLVDIHSCTVSFALIDQVTAAVTQRYVFQVPNVSN